MKKFKYLVSIIALSTILVGAGYAGWTEKVNLQTTVETGKFCVQIENIREQVNKKTNRFSDVTMNNMVTTEHSTDNEPQQVTLDMTNIYPGAEQSYQVTFRNKGTVDAVISGANVVVTEGYEHLVDKLEMRIDEGEFFACDTASESITEQLEQRIDRGVISKGETLILDITIRMKNLSINEYESFDHHQQQKAKINVEFTWEQKNLKEDRISQPEGDEEERIEV